MNMICRIAKKIRLTEHYFTLEKLGFETGVIDTDGNLKVMREDTDEIKIYPVYSDPEFLDSDSELCYCDERSRDGILSTIENVSTKAELFQKYKEMTDDNLYIIEYDKESQTSQSLPFNSNEYSRLVELKEALEILKDKGLYESDKVCFVYIRGGILTTKETIKYLKQLILIGKTEEAIEILDTVIEDYNTTNCIEEDNDDIAIEAAIKTIQGIEKTKKNDEENKASILPNRPLKDVMKDINSLVGLENIKDYVDGLSKEGLFDENPLTKKAKINLDVEKENLCFLGNPGTGKTTVAKLFSEILYKFGYTNGKFEDVKASDLIAGYVGQTALKTEKVLEDVRGGVLFLDEAYSLLSGADENSSSFSKDAINSLMREMASGKTIFIFAGYKKEMETFLETNSGLKSRINRYIEFRDYTVEELYKMFTNKVKQANLKLTHKAKEVIIDLISQASTQKNFGNGRYIDSLFKNIVRQHKKNTYNSKDIKVIQTITTQDVDIEESNKVLYKKLEGNKIGF